MKKVFPVTILLLLSILVLVVPGYLGCLDCLADDFTETSFSPEFEEDSNQYYWGSQRTVTVHKQLIGEEYQLCIGANQPISEQQWINYTATHANAEITFRHNTEPYDDNDNELTYLLLTLYNDGSSIANLTFAIILPTDQYDPGAIVQTWAIIGLIIFTVVVLVMLLKRR